MAYVISKACTNCGACLPKCPSQSITVGALQHVIDSDTCDGFAACVAVCPVNAISLAPSRLEAFRAAQRTPSVPQAKGAQKPQSPGGQSKASGKASEAAPQERTIAGSIEAILKEYETRARE